MKISTLTTEDGKEIKIIDYPSNLVTHNFTPEEIEKFKKMYERTKEIISNNSIVGICSHVRPKFSLGLVLNWDMDKANDTNLLFSDLELNHHSVSDIERILREKVNAMTNRTFRSVRVVRTCNFHTFKVLYEYGEFDGHRTDTWCDLVVITIAPRMNSPWCPMCGNQKGFYGNLTKSAYYYTPEQDGTPSTLTPLNDSDSKIDEATLICAHCGCKDVLETKFMELALDESQHFNIYQPKDTPSMPEYGKFYYPKDEL